MAVDSSNQDAAIIVPHPAGDREVINPAHDRITDELTDFLSVKDGVKPESIWMAQCATPLLIKEAVKGLG